ncbi:alkaline phosphatase PhoX [Anabaena sp. UHCC 0451]|uniref:alkaline phosphatase PhoX n=1 Tax=Anabaena sp. UHCC 0451 TaxID=2055235 RepID=UPI002B20789E|nr:alkaline phosphatase PhoX [Anabaena sp. UHCC 0451]MEA5576827.1 alkaline phosphatase PhoX [Anabaena sp. UHCC 0451]
MTNTPFDTNQPAQVKGLNGYTVDPIFTVGDKIGDYVPPGILDGIGAFSLNDTTVRLLVNHELGSAVGYQYTLKNGTQLPGARVSFFDVDKRTLQIVDSGLAYDTIINRQGEVVDAASDLDFAGLARFCSAALFEAHEFGAGKGFADRIFFTGEENDGGSEFALDTATNTLYALPWLGRAAWENVTTLDTGTTDKVAILIGDDRDPAPLILYVGTKNSGGNFLERNGLVGGELFVWVADDPADASDTIEADPRDFSGTNNFTGGKFVEIDYYRPDLASATPIAQTELGYDSQGFATQAQQDKLAADVQAFLFSRPEDVATNPQDGTQAVLASTGRESIFDGADTWGTTYKVDVDFSNLNTGDITARLDILYDANEADKKDFGLRSPDNLDWADDGKIYIQEDRAISSTLFGATSGEETSIWKLDPSVADPSSTLTRIGQVDRSGIPSGQVDSNPADLGNWETSGILDVSNLFGNQPGELFIFDVQAGTLNNGTIITATNIDGNGDGTPTANENLVRGGQLAFLVAPNASLVQDSQLVSTSSNADQLIAGIDFDGVNDIVFTGAGNDEVDVPFGGILAGNNRVFTGSGADIIYVGNDDRAFGGSSDDEIDATDATGYRISGGAGNDIFYLGADGRALGGDGDDKFFVQEGGGNLISGGAGADQFWIVNGDLPTAANTIADFEMGTDVLGISGQGAGFDFSDLTLSGNSIAIGATTIAMLNGVNTTSLTAANFAFV